MRSSHLQGKFNDFQENSACDKYEVGALRGEWILVGPVETCELVVVLISLSDALAYVRVLGHWSTRNVRSVIFKQIFSIVIALSFTRLAEMQDFATAAVSALAPSQSIFPSIIIIIFVSRFLHTKTSARLITATPFFIPRQVKMNLGLATMTWF